MSDLKMLQPQKVQNIINRFCYTIGMIPTSYKLSLSFEEQLLAIGRYLEDTVIPALNNNAEAVAELQNLFVDLQNYVNNYFDDLDVQNEINKKLDEMAQSGELANIINQQIFSDLNTNINKNAEEIAKINTNLEKAIILPNDEIVADGVTDVTVPLQQLINNNPYSIIRFTKGDYLISSPIQIYEDNEGQCDLHFDSGARLFSNAYISSLIEIGNERENATSHYTLYQKGYIETISGSGILDASNCDQAILHVSNRHNTRLIGLNIVNCAKYGIRSVGPTLQSINNSSGIKILNCTITGQGNPDTSNIGIYLESNDNELDQIAIQRFLTGMNFSSGGNIVSNIHLTAFFVPSSNNIAQNFNKAIGVRLSGANAFNIFNNIYIDTYNRAMIFTGANSNTLINNMYTYYYFNNEDCVVSIFSPTTNARISVSNSRFTVANDGTNRILDLRYCSNALRRNYNAFNLFKFVNCTSYNQVLLDTDPFNAMQIRNEDSVTIVTEPYSQYMEADLYYPIAILRNGSYDLNVRMESNIMSNVGIFVPASNSSTPAQLKTKGLISATDHENSWNLALCEYKTDDNIHYVYLCVRAPGHRWHYNPIITQLSKGFVENVFSFPGFNSYEPLNNPSVILETNLYNV